MAVVGRKRIENAFGETRKEIVAIKNWESRMFNDRRQKTTEKQRGEKCEID